MSAIAADPKDAPSILAACEGLPAAPSDAVEQLVGDWRSEWSTLSAPKRKPERPAGETKPPPISLRMLSFGALPDVPAYTVGSFNRVSGSAEGGVYELFTVFSTPDADGARAAMVLSGPWGRDPDGEPGRASVHFQTVTLVPSMDDPEASSEMLRSAGLAVTSPVPLRAPPTHIDVRFIDGAMRVHAGASGEVYVLSRGEVPFKSAWPAA